MHLILFFVVLIIAGNAYGSTEGGINWLAPDRGAKVSALIPGRGIPPLTRENLFTDWTRQQVERWNKEHPGGLSEQVYQTFSNTAPTDAELTADFPRHISPFAQVRSGKPEDFKIKGALLSYCPFCQSRSFSISYDPRNPYHGTANCCRTELYGREQDFPPGYALKPTETVKFLHLDDTSVEVPCTVYRDKDGVEWNLFIKTIFDQRRWLQAGDLVKHFGQKFYDTADPLYAYKMAVILDQVADTYYGLPLSYLNELANGKDGKPLTRAEWEAVSRPAIFEKSYLGEWNRRTPIFNRGWIELSKEHIWVEPFARVRHHPAFKYYSQKKYGDPEALDKKIMTRLLREIALMFKGVHSEMMLTNYQNADHVGQWLLGVLLGDEILISFGGPAQEVTMYNHTYQDGLNGEGAPNYMAMPGGYFYPYLRDPKGWLQFYPKFLEEHPFYFAADAEMRKLTTVRGMQVEFGDQHEYAFAGGLLIDPARIRENEKIGSRNWAGYGVGILRVGGPGHRQELCLDYTRASLHNAQDALSLECWVDGVPVLRKGGYAQGKSVVLQWERPEFQAFKKMDYPKEIIGPKEIQDGRDKERWAWNYAHSPLCQNNVTIDEVGTGAGWGDNRGYGEVITFKGGEADGEPGSGFQVLDVRDHYSWSRMNKKIDDYRRTLIGVEGPDGRPYVLDIFKVKGEGRQALYSGAWADPVDEQLPPVKRTADDLVKVLFPDSPRQSVIGDMPFPQTWLMFGPVAKDAPEPDTKALASVPSELVLANQKLAGRKVTLTDNRIDLGALLDGKQEGKTAYLFTEVEVPADTEVTLGAGADWWMRWWVNGRPVSDTLADGNHNWPPQISDYRFKAQLKKGRNTLAVKVISGSGSFVLAAGGPLDLRKLPKLPSGLNPEQQIYECVRNVKQLAPPDGNWELTWKTDCAAYAPRDPDGKPFKRPLPDDVGRVRLRLIGITQPDGQTELIRGKGPWISWIKQPLPGGQSVDGYVAFMDARDLLIERRNPAPGQTNINSLYIHILEGYCEGEKSAIKSVTPLPAKSLKGPSRDIVALKLEMADGHSDIVIYQSEAGSVQVPGGIETDARYALLRQAAAGNVIAALWRTHRPSPVTVEMCRGTYLTSGNFSASLPGDFSGTIVDVVGDLTGTRQESALIIKPDKPWPAGADLKGRQLLIRFESELRNPGNEGYRVEKVTPMDGGLVRVEVQDHAPFITSWHEVTVLPTNKPNAIRTWRPMVDHGNNPWYNGLKLWVPERNKLYTIKKVNAVGGGYGGDTVELVENVNLAAEGIKVGDWYVIYGVQPGLRVTVANDFCFRQEPAAEWKQYSLRATGPVTIKAPVIAGAFSYRFGDEEWKQAKTSKPGFTADAGGRPVQFMVNKPAWLNLNDKTAPTVTKISLDGREVTPDAAKDLGAIDLPKLLMLEIVDAENPLDLAGLKVTFNGKTMGKDLVKTAPGPQDKSVKVEINLDAALAAAGPAARKHRLEVSVADKSVARHLTVAPVSFVKRIELEKDAVYLSDLTPVSSFAHGGLIKDRDYVGNPCLIRGVFYGKCLTVCPEPSPDGVHGEVIYKLPAVPANPAFYSDIGISDSSLGDGSATFLVQVSDAPQSKWETLYNSAVLRGGADPITIKMALGQAKYLRLYTTDADDGISSDHAVWGNARLKPGE